MGFQIEDGTGKGFRTRVNSRNRMLVTSVNQELQHFISLSDGRSYQIIGDHTLSTSGSHTILHVRNTDPERILVISYMRVQFPGGDGTIDTNTYFQFGFGTSYSTGGSSVSPVNVNTQSGNSASIVAYDGSPTVTGTFEEIDRWYPDKSMQTFNKHGSVILGLNDTFEWRLVTDQSSGVAYARVTFMMIDTDGN